MGCLCLASVLIAAPAHADDATAQRAPPSGSTTGSPNATDNTSTIVLGSVLSAVGAAAMILGGVMIAASPEDDCAGECSMPEQKVAGIVLVSSGVALTGVGVTTIVLGATQGPPAAVGSAVTPKARHATTVGLRWAF